MTEHAETERSIRLTRIGRARFEATNRRGSVLTIGSGDDPGFSPIELFLAAMAGCSAIDVDLITGRRAEATRLDITARGDKVRDDLGNRLVNLRLTLDVEFPAGEAGDRARDVLPVTAARVRDRLCTVTRTVAVGEPVVYVVPGVDLSSS